MDEKKIRDSLNALRDIANGEKSSRSNAPANGTALELDSKAIIEEGGNDRSTEMEHVEEMAGIPGSEVPEGTAATDNLEAEEAHDGVNESDSSSESEHALVVGEQVAISAKEPSAKSSSVGEDASRTVDDLLAGHTLPDTSIPLKGAIDYKKINQAVKDGLICLDERDGEPLVLLTSQGINKLLVQERMAANEMLQGIEDKQQELVALKEQVKELETQMESDIARAQKQSERIGLLQAAMEKDPNT